LQPLPTDLCFCSSNKPFSQCCGRFLSGKQEAATPEELMRSRYCAFVVKDFEYLSRTHDVQTIHEFNISANQAWADAVTFTQLEILKAEESGNKGLVEFIAHFTLNETGESQKHHEISKFRKQAGVWYFKEGKVSQS
jgi:SEC-C motif-containing protein